MHDIEDSIIYATSTFSQRYTVHVNLLYMHKSIKCLGSVSLRPFRSYALTHRQLLFIYIHITGKQ